MSKYDIIIAGSGLGGLCCGYILAKEGYNVCIIEKNRQFGGNLQTFVRDKCIFDTGVHYLGGLEPGQNLHMYFTYLGIMDKLKLRRMNDHGFDRVSFEGDEREYWHSVGYENFIENLVQHFPNSRGELTRYCNDIKKVCDGFPMYRVQETGLGNIDLRSFETSAHDYLKETISDPALRAAVSGTVMLYGGDKQTSSLYQHAVTINSYLESAYKCVDGGAQITKYLVRNIRALGGTLINYSEVKEFHIDNQKIEYVLLDSGERIYGDSFISNIHPAITNALVTPGKMRASFVERIQSLQNSTSVFCLHIVFKDESFPYLDHNYYHHYSTDVWNSARPRDKDWPSGFMAITPASSKSETYADCMTIMTYMDISMVEKWGNSYNIIPHMVDDRGPEYQEFKEIYSEKILTLIEKKFPGIRSKIKSLHTSTPLSYRDYINTPDGSIYGIVKDYNHPMSTILSHKTRISNLYLTGQNLATHGILGVTLTAIKTCSEFLDQNYLIRKIREAN